MSTPDIEKARRLAKGLLDRRFAEIGRPQDLQDYFFALGFWGLKDEEFEKLVGNNFAELLEKPEKFREDGDRSDAVQRITVDINTATVREVLMIVWQHESPLPFANPTQIRTRIDSAVLAKLLDIYEHTKPLLRFILALDAFAEGEKPPNRKVYLEGISFLRDLRADSAELSADASESLTNPGMATMAFYELEVDGIILCCLMGNTVPAYVTEDLNERIREAFARDALEQDSKKKNDIRMELLALVTRHETAPDEPKKADATAALILEATPSEEAVLGALIGALIPITRALGLGRGGSGRGRHLKE